MCFALRGAEPGGGVTLWPLLRPEVPTLSAPTSWSRRAAGRSARAGIGRCQHGSLSRPRPSTDWTLRKWVTTTLLALKRPLELVDSTDRDRPTFALRTRRCPAALRARNRDGRIEAVPANSRSSPSSYWTRPKWVTTPLLRVGFGPLCFPAFSLAPLTMPVPKDPPSSGRCAAAPVGVLITASEPVGGLVRRFVTIKGILGAPTCVPDSSLRKRSEPQTGMNVARLV